MIGAKEEYHCHPFFDFMLESRDRNELGFDAKAKKSIMLGNDEMKHNKHEFTCLMYKYKSTPQYLDQGLMTMRFVQTLRKGEKLQEFDKFCKKNMEEAKEHRKERKKVERKHRI